MKFRFSEEFEIDTADEPWRTQGLRAGFFATSGAGKSYNVAILAEQWLDQGGTVVIIEPLAEWHTLKQAYPIQVVGGPHAQDLPLVESEPKLYARAVVERGISLVIYTRDIEDEEALVKFVRDFVYEIMTLQEVHHRPLLLVIEETHEYAPRTPTGHIAPPWVYNRMIKILKDCFTQGRKLNITPVAMSQRPQEVNFTVRQLCNLVWFGGFSAQDARYIDREILSSYRDEGVDVSADDLVGVATGEWLVIAGRETRQVVVTTRRRTPHGADTPRLEYTAPVDIEIQEAISDLGEQLREMLAKREEERSEVEKLRRRIRDLEKENESLEERVRLAGNLRELLQHAPAEGADLEAELKRRIEELSSHYEEKIDELERENRELNNQVLDYGRELERAEESLNHLGDKLTRFENLEYALRELVTGLIEVPEKAEVDESTIEAVVDRKIQSLSASKRRRIRDGAGETGIPWLDMWMSRVGTAERKILRFMAERYPLRMTKSQIALGVGLTAGGGYFTSALNNLVKWRLVIRDGSYYRLAEGPP